MTALMAKPGTAKAQSIMHRLETVTERAVAAGDMTHEERVRLLEDCGDALVVYVIGGALLARQREARELMEVGGS